MAERITWRASRRACIEGGGPAASSAATPRSSKIEAHVNSHGAMFKVDHAGSASNAWRRPATTDRLRL
eukprot:6172058-Pleurochrysis_carterae.AAC.1